MDLTKKPDVKPEIVSSALSDKAQILQQLNVTLTNLTVLADQYTGTNPPWLNERIQQVTCRILELSR